MDFEDNSLKNNSMMHTLPKFHKWEWVEDKKYGDTFLKYCQQRLYDGIKPKTLMNEWERILPFFKYLDSRKFCGDERQVTEKHIRDYSTHINNSNLTQNGKWNKLRVIKYFYRKIYSMGLILNDPTEDLKLPKEERNKINILSIKQMKQLLESPSLDTALGIRDRTILELTYSSALRIGDVSSLSVNSFDDKYESIKVCGKGDKEAILPVTKMAAHFTKFYIDNVRPIINKHNRLELFINQRGDFLNTHQVYIVIMKYIKQCDFAEGITPHSIRASICTHLSEQDVDIRYLQEYMRHTKLDTLASYLNPQQKQIKSSFRKYHPIAT